MKHVLFIDDEALLHTLVEEALADTYLITHAHNGKEGISRYFARKPDVIVTDLNMGHPDGLEVIAHLRGEDKTTPIILTSTDIGNDAVLRVKEPYQFLTLEKPYAPKALSALIELVLSHKPA